MAIRDPGVTNDPTHPTHVSERQEGVVLARDLLQGSSWESCSRHARLGYELRALGILQARAGWDQLLGHIHLFRLLILDGARVSVLGVENDQGTPADGEKDGNEDSENAAVHETWILKLLVA